MAYYRKEDWDRLMDSCVDRDRMHDTWEEWEKAFMKAKKGLEEQGMIVHKVVVDIDLLNLYCRANGLLNIGATRAEYVGNLPPF